MRSIGTDIVVNSPETWQIPSRRESCSACETPLEPGAQVMVLLSFDGEGPQRRDLCVGCGEGVGKEVDGFYWKREQPVDGASSPVVDYAFLQEMFGRMLERDEEVYRRLAYLVGLVLIRKRHLRLKSFGSRDGREVMTVTRGAGQPELVVPAPFLSAEDMVDTREMLSRLLAADLPEGDLPEPPRAGEPEASPVDATPAPPASQDQSDPAAGGDQSDPAAAGSEPPPAAELN